MHISIRRIELRINLILGFPETFVPIDYVFELLRLTYGRYGVVIGIVVGGDHNRGLYRRLETVSWFNAKMVLTLSALRLENAE